MILQLISIWVVAIFGFQVLLKIIEKPTPEPVYSLYEQSWPAIRSGDFTSKDLQALSQVSLSILGKVAIQPGHRQALDNAVSWAAWNLAQGDLRLELEQRVSQFRNTASEITHIGEVEYLQEKEALYPLLAGLFDLNPRDVRVKIAPLEIHTELMPVFGEENQLLVAEAMDLYLIHMRSVLTDTPFLGFPFHYFYTAVFLLILFVGLCWIYCRRTDMFNKKYGIED